MVTFLLLIWIICSTSEILWQQPMNSSDYSGWVSSGNTVSYRSSDLNCPYNNQKCWKMCGQLSGDWTSELTRTSTSTIGKINTRLTFDIETTSFTNECSIEWSIDNWNTPHEIISKSFGSYNEQAKTVTFTGADNSTAVSIRIRVFEGDGDCCYISRFVLEADSLYSNTPTTQPTTVPTVPTVPTTSYPTAGDGTAIRVIIDSWSDDYSIIAPVRWYATRDTNNYGSTIYTPPILTGNNGKYHGKYTGDINNDGTRYYMSLHQTFLCAAHAMIDISFTVIVCGTENDDNFYFYLDNVEKESFTVSTSSLLWSSVSDSAVSCSSGSAEQNTFSYINLLEVLSNTDSFAVKFNFDSNSANEAILVTDIKITCNVITTNPTNNPTDITVSPTNIPTHNPITISPTIPTTNPIEITSYPTNSNGISVRIISGLWNDDYSISNPFKWQTLMDTNNPPQTTITPLIFTGNEGEYHGPYQSDTDGTEYYVKLWQQFRCDTYSIVDVSFIFVICGTESTDYFEFYFNDIISTDGQVTLALSNWDSVTDALISCSDTSNIPEQHLFVYNNLAIVQPMDIFDIKFFMKMSSNNEGLYINNITVTCHPTTPQPTNNPTAPTTAYPTTNDGTSIRIIYDIWHDDYITSNPFKWQALRSIQNPPTTSIQPYIFSGNNGQYHGPYQGTSSGNDFYYVFLWQKFRCWKHSIVHISFTLAICGTENTDKFAFYFDDTISSHGKISLGISSNNFNPVTDSAISCSQSSAEQNTFNYTNLREVQSSNDIFDVKFEFMTDSNNEGVWITDVTIICDIIITNNPTNIPTYNPTNTPTNNPTITTVYPTNNPIINPTTYPTIYPTISTNNPTITPTNNPTNIPSIYPTIKNPTISPTTIPSNNPSVYPTLNPSIYPNTQNPSVIPTIYPSYAPSTHNPSGKPTSQGQGEIGETTRINEIDSNDNGNLHNSIETNRLLLIYIGIAAVFAFMVITICVCMIKKRKRMKKSETKVMDESGGNIQMEMALTGLKKVKSCSVNGIGHEIEIEYGTKTNEPLHGNGNGNGINPTISLTAEGIGLGVIGNVFNLQETINDAININDAHDDLIIGGDETMGGYIKNDNSEFIVEDGSDIDNDILMEVNTQTIGGTLQDENDNEQNTFNEGNPNNETKGKGTGSMDELLQNDEFVIHSDQEPVATDIGQ